jgi:hypothetical protein
LDSNRPFICSVGGGGMETMATTAKNVYKMGKLRGELEMPWLVLKGEEGKGAWVELCIRGVWTRSEIVNNNTTQQSSNQT